MEAVLAAEDVRKSYGETVALDGVSLTVAAGEVFALIGPNGAGKTTFVRALTGTTTPSAGAVSVLGASPTVVDRTRIGLLPQAFDPPSRLTARELVAYYAGLYPESRDPDDVLADVGVADSADVRYENLSGGQQRRVCVATSLVNDPDVLFLDEPTTGVDPAGRRSMWRLFENLAESGTTIFLTTHSMAEAERLADRVGLLADGSIVEVGEPDILVREHGGVSRLVVETNASVSDLPFDADATDNGFVVPDVDPRDIGDIVGELETAGVAYEALTWKQPDLEDVYLQLAGETLESTVIEQQLQAVGERR